MVLFRYLKDHNEKFICLSLFFFSLLVLTQKGSNIDII